MAYDKRYGWMGVHHDLGTEKARPFGYVALYWCNKLVGRLRNPSNTKWVHTDAELVAEVDRIVKSK